MISLSKYEIENKHKRQDLGSDGGGGWGVLTISDSKNSATLHALCAGALSCIVLGAYVLFSLSLRYLSPLVHSVSIRILKLKSQLSNS